MFRNIDPAKVLADIILGAIAIASCASMLAALTFIAVAVGAI